MESKANEMWKWSNDPRSESNNFYYLFHLQYIFNICLHLARRNPRSAPWIYYYQYFQANMQECIYNIRVDEFQSDPINHWKNNSCLEITISAVAPVTVQRFIWFFFCFVENFVKEGRVVLPLLRRVPRQSRAGCLTSSASKSPLPKYTRCLTFGRVWQSPLARQGGLSYLCLVESFVKVGRVVVLVRNPDTDVLGH